MAPGYPQKVHKQAYQQLLAELAFLNGPSGTGFFKLVRQTRNASEDRAQPVLRFNGQEECIWFQRHDGEMVCQSFHYPHGRDSSNELPAGMLHDYRNVFAAFGIAADIDA